MCAASSWVIPSTVINWNMVPVLMLTGSRRLRIFLSCFGDEPTEAVSAFPFRLLTEALAVMTEALEL